MIYNIEFVKAARMGLVPWPFSQGRGECYEPGVSKQLYIHFNSTMCSYFRFRSILTFILIINTILLNANFQMLFHNMHITNLMQMAN